MYICNYVHGLCLCQDILNNLLYYTVNQAIYKNWKVGSETRLQFLQPNGDSVGKEAITALLQSRSMLDVTTEVQQSLSSGLVITYSGGSPISLGKKQVNKYNEVDYKIQI